ncbi:MAG: hypothetical protein IIA48_11070 [Bacteroidetes bacterium]|nr:hypothetical protein [Bacteroidota bacterium]
MPDLLTIKEASYWATDYLKKNVTTSNISYLIQYGRVKKIADNGCTLIDKNDLINYYEQSYNGRREIEWKTQLGDDLNWVLSFDHLKEADTTKHSKVCKPLFSILKYWKLYSKDTVKRLTYFDKLRTNTYQRCPVGDSRIIDIFQKLKK